MIISVGQTRGGLQPANARLRAIFFSPSDGRASDRSRDREGAGSSEYDVVLLAQTIFFRHLSTHNPGAPQ